VGSNFVAMDEGDVGGELVDFGRWGVERSRRAGSGADNDLFEVAEGCFAGAFGPVSHELGWSLREVPGTGRLERLLPE
jgi:hypothetical protein